MDDKLLEHLLEKGVPTFSMSSGLTLDDFGWGSPTFHKMVRQQRRPAGGVAWLAVTRQHTQTWGRFAAAACAGRLRWRLLALLIHFVSQLSSAL